APRWARRTALQNLVRATDALEAPGIVSVAAIDGPAFGGGMELALACDLRVASDRPDAWLAQPEVLGGVMAGFGATWRLPRLIGAARALELLVLGEAIDPHRAAAWGLVNRVLPAATFQDDVWALARRLATRPAGAVAGTKRALGRGPWRELAEVLTVWSSPDADRGLARAAVTIATEAARPTRRPLPELLAELERPPG
ncbi:MAG: enoyl-CoA hydratase/isomerase family protein, partial [Myxococcota bacterium]